jgi:uncharacterized protein
VLTLEQFTGFDWDEGNRGKNWEKHGVTDSECEQVFFNQPMFVFADTEHSIEEQRYYVLGRTDQGRRLFVVLTREETRSVSSRHGR